MKRILLIIALILMISMNVFGQTGIYTSNSFFYLPLYGAYGSDEYAAYNAAMEVADNAIKDNETASGDENIQDTAGAMFTGNTETGITITYQDADRTIDAVIGDDDIVESMLKFVNTGNDEEIVTRETSTGDFEYHTLAELSIQPLDTALTNISALAYVTPSFIKLTADDTYAVRTLAQTLTDIGGAASGVNADITSMTGLDDNGIPLVKVTNAASDGANTDITSLTGVNLIDVDILNFADATELTIATGAITITQSYHKIDTEADAASDDLTTISGGTAGDVIYLCAENDARTVVLKHDDTAGAGKIITSDGEDYSLDDDNKVVTFVYNSVDSHWHMVGAAGGGAGETNTASNVGGQVEIFKQKTGVDLEFRTLKADTNKILVTTTPEGGEITIGREAKNRAFTWAVYTSINKGGVASDTGTITSVEIWANSGLSNCEVATFYIVSGSNFSTRDYEAIGTVAAGSKQTFGVSLDVQAGDYLGIFYTSGGMEKDNTGSGIWYTGYGVDNIPCTDVTFGLNSGIEFSLYGTGVTSTLDYIRFDVVETEMDVVNLLSTTTVAFNANADTTLYTVPTGKRCVLTHAIVVAAGDAGATTTISIGANGAETDFIPANTLSNLDAQYDSAILQPIPNTTPLKIKSYAAATVIEAQVASQSGAAGNTIYLFGILY